jgi:signal transduction histidine kinase/ActR/RegA family two-component response regulator
MRFQLRSSLRGKTLLIVLATVAGLVGGIEVLSRVVLLRGFSKLETDFARQNLQQAFSGISNEIETLDHTTAQFADQDQTYAYVRARNPERIAAEFPDPLLEQLRINFVAVLDDAGRPVFLKGFNLATMTAAPISPGLSANLQPGSQLLARRGQLDDLRGILMLPSGLAMVARSPVLTSDSKGPAAGTLIMGRLLDSDEILRLGAITHLPIEIEAADAGDPPPDFRVAASTVTGGAPVLIRPATTDTLAAYRALHDIYGKPVAIMRILLPRQIYNQSQTSLLQFLLLLLTCGFLFGALTLYLLERFVISRVADLAENITAIGTSGDLAARLPVSGKDELAYLGTAVNGMLEDLEKVQVERHQERTRLAVMVETMPAVLWTANAELRITSAMGAGLHAVGLGARESAGLTLLDFFRTRDPEFPAIVAHRKALAGEAVSFETSWEMRRFESHVQPLHDGEGGIHGVIGVALDVTERDRLTDQLRQAHKMQAVGELAGGVAHDFNNLLMVVKGHAQLLLDRLLDPYSVQQSVLQIEKAADRAASLARQLLAFTRKQVLQPRVLDMNEVVAGTIRMFSRVVGENIEMAFLPGASLGRVKADPLQLEQVLLNLVVNARDAMPDGGRLTIETSNVDLDRTYSARHVSTEPGPYVMLAVTDTGCGMDVEIQNHIFEPFFTTKGPGKGTGLGLAIVYGIVKQSGGYTWAYSEVGHGTTFKIYLPRVMAEVDRPAAETGPTDLARGSETILCVEDEQSVRELISDYLRGIGYAVLEAPDGPGALKVAAAHPGPIHILITDVVMPHLSGPALAAQIGAVRPGLKVLLVSGYTDDTVFRHGVIKGGVAYLQKPFNLKALAQKIREVLNGQPVAVVPHAELERN